MSRRQATASTCARLTVGRSGRYVVGDVMVAVVVRRFGSGVMVGGSRHPSSVRGAPPSEAVVKLYQATTGADFPAGSVEVTVNSNAGQPGDRVYGWEAVAVHVLTVAVRRLATGGEE